MRVRCCSECAQAQGILLGKTEKSSGVTSKAALAAPRGFPKCREAELAFDPYVYHHVQRYLAHSNIVCLLFGILLCQTRPSQFVVSTYSSGPTGFGRCISYHSSAGLHVAFNECNKTDNQMKTKARSCHTAYLQPPSTEDSSMIEGDTKFANAEELKEWLLGQGVDEDDVVEAVDRLFAMKFNRPSRLFGITVRRSEEAHLH